MVGILAATFVIVVLFVTPTAMATPAGDVTMKRVASADHKPENCRIATLSIRLSHYLEKRTMRRILIPLVITAWVATPAIASEEKDVVAVVGQWTGLFNKDTATSALATCADEASIIDDMSPYTWFGSGACARFLNVLTTESEKSAVTELSSTLLKPRHLAVTGDRAFVVVPINFTFKLDGKVTKETGTVLTAALQKGPAGWRITAVSMVEH